MKNSGLFALIGVLLILGGLLFPILLIPGFLLFLYGAYLRHKRIEAMMDKIERMGEDK